MRVMGELTVINAGNVGRWFYHKTCPGERALEQDDVQSALQAGSAEVVSGGLGRPWRHAPQIND